MSRKLPGILVAGALLLTLLPASVAAADPDRGPARLLPDSVEQLRLDKPVTLTGDAAAAKIATKLRDAQGRQRVIVRLSARPAIELVADTAAAQRGALAAAKAQQDAIIAKAKSLDPKVSVLGRTGKASNVVILKVDAGSLAALAKDRSVVAIVPVKDYSLDLSETVGYISALKVQNLGFKGQGVDVAILDSGIDYTHAALGGAGTIDAFKAAYGESTDDAKNTTLDGLFPTARVKGGYDFTGEAWPNEDEAPDPDPIDSPDSGTDLGIDMETDGGHGTHVADIIGGTKGVAPRANLYAVKVCSSISTSCSGVALMHAMDWAMDPNGDGFLNDHVDIINMSLGSDYGTVADDDLSLAVERATHYAGILTVAASGNGANKPYVSGTPAAAPSALSVAQTQVPSAKTFPLVISAPPAIAGTYANTETVDWAPVGSGFSGDVTYVGQGCPADSIEPGSPEDPYLSDPAGKIALIDRGDCSISLKVDRAAEAGAVAVLLKLIAPGDAVSFSYGGGDTFVPTVVIQESLGDDIIDQLDIPVTVTASVSSATFVKLVGSMAGTSSRGPDSLNRIKPEIGAPGASVSAVSGSGTETQAFGGTSGATPMVSGSAALLRGAFPNRTPLEIKAVLMNTAETTVYTNPALQPGVVAPITRIGGGEVRVNRALKSPIAVWDAAGQSGSLSFGFVDGSKDLTITRWLTVRNYTGKTLRYAITPKFRYGNDRTNGAVQITSRTKITLQPHQTRVMRVTLTLDASKLRDWTMNGGEFGVDPVPLDLLEYDGYINFNRFGFKGDNADPLHVAWQVLPRKSGDVRVPGGTTVPLETEADVQNVGAGAAAIDMYSLVATSPDKPGSRTGMNAPVIDLRAVGVQTFLVPAGFCGLADSFVYRIAINTWDRQTTAVVPGELDVDLDINGDDTPDFNIFSGPLSLGGLSDARAVTWVYDYDAQDISAFFFTDHGTNDSNTILTFCGDQIGQDATDLGSPWTMDVTAYDWYYRDYAITDQVTGIEVAPFAEHYWGEIGGFGYSADIPALSTDQLIIFDLTSEYAYPVNPSETGLLLVANADRFTYRGGAVKGRESIMITVPEP
jgi:subtilisin family serine protease